MGEFRKKVNSFSVVESAFGGVRGVRISLNGQSIIFF